MARIHPTSPLCVCLLLVLAAYAAPLPAPLVGTDFVGTGYDASIGAPSAVDMSKFGIDPGLKVGAVVMDPSSVVSAPYFECQQDSTTSVYTSFDDVRNSFTESTGGTGLDETLPLDIKSIGFDGFKVTGDLDLRDFHFLKFSFSASKSKQSYEEHFSSERQVVMHATAQCQVQQAMVRSFDFTLSRGFRAYVDQMALGYSHSDALQFASFWGTHVVTKVNYGGAYALSFTFTESAWGSLKMDATRTHKAATQILFFTLAGSHDTSKLSTDARSVQSASTTLNIHTLGSSDTSDWDSWVEDVKRNAVPVQLPQLMPLPDLLSANNFPNDTNIVAKRTVMAAYIACILAGFPSDGRCLEEHHDPVCPSGCANGGTCVQDNVCSCTDGWSGLYCEEPVCQQPCQNGGQCTAPNTCQCPPDIFGDHCELLVDKACWELCEKCTTQGGWQFWNCGATDRSCQPIQSSYGCGGSHTPNPSECPLACPAS